MANRDPTGFQRASRLDFHTKVSFGLYFVASWNDNDYKVKHPDKHYTSVEGTQSDFWHVQNVHENQLSVEWSLKHVE